MNGHPLQQHYYPHHYHLAEYRPQLGVIGFMINTVMVISLVSIAISMIRKTLAGEEVELPFGGV